MQAYFREGEARAMALGNRGPIRFAEDGTLHPDILDAYPKLTAYKQRGEARPAFARALADQSADLGEPIKLGEPA